jgi:AraC-like DNA-binding protein
MLRPTDKDTVSAYFVRAALLAVPAEAVPRLLDAAQIPAALLRRPQARVPAPSFAALWMAVAQELDDEFFGLDTRRMKVGSFGLLTRAVLHAQDLGHALQRCLHGFAVLLDDVGGELVVDDDEARIVVTNRIADAERRRFADETFLVMVHGLACWLAGRRLALTRAEFAHPAPPAAADYRVIYAREVIFDAPRTALVFDAKLLAARIVQDQTTLKTFLRDAPQSVFLKYRDRDSLTAQLRRRLRGSLGADQWPRFDEVASEFGIAPTTLRRRLEAEGSSYQALKDELRRDAAIHHLSESDASVAEIAARLGFADAAAFHRAFRKWTGAAPGEYRRPADGQG